MLEQVLDFDSCIEGDARKLLMHGAGDAHGVGRSIEEVGVAKGDMTYTLGYLCADVCQHDLGWYGEEAATVDWRDGAMQAGMLAAARRFSISREQPISIQLQAGGGLGGWAVMAVGRRASWAVNRRGAFLLKCADATDCNRLDDFPTRDA